MNTNASVFTLWPPLPLSMQAMVELIAAVQLVVTLDLHPVMTGPTLLGVMAIQMATNAFRLSIEPTGRFVEMVSLDKCPVRSDMSPVALVVPAQGAKAIKVDTNSLRFSVVPSLLPMQFVIEVISTEQFPVSTHVHPACSSPASENTLAVEVTPNATVTSPTPTSRLVKMLVAPHRPLGLHTSPSTLHIAPQNTSAVLV